MDVSFHSFCYDLRYEAFELAFELHASKIKSRFHTLIVFVYFCLFDRGTLMGTLLSSMFPDSKTVEPELT